MSYRALGIYREPEFSPGKVEADAAILDSVLAELAREGYETSTMDAQSFGMGAPVEADIILAMCQGEKALKRLAEVEQAGAITINSALAIRNCYRDLLASGLRQAGVPTPAGALIPTDGPIDLRRLVGMDLSSGVFVKRGDLHALAADDVQRIVGRAELESTLKGFASRGVPMAYVQQEAVGGVVKFYGVAGGYFSALPEGDEIPEAAVRGLSEAAHRAAAALGLVAWGGDAVLSGDRFAIIDFNDWPSYGRVRAQAARAIAHHAISMMSRPRRLSGRSEEGLKTPLT